MIKSGVRLHLDHFQQSGEMPEGYAVVKMCL